VGAHHDSAPGSPGACDDGGGVGVLLELARVMARAPSAERNLVFVSFDGEEGFARGSTLAGSRAFVDALGPEARDVVAMVAIEMSGWKAGVPTLHTIAYADPLRQGEYVVTPAWLVREALSGARRAELRAALGDPYLSWLYQPAVRTVKARLYGDDLSFLERGVPALMVSDSSFSSFYPYYHTPRDTADKLDADALGRMGEAVHGMLERLDQAQAGPPERQWFGAFGVVLGRLALTLIGIASLLPLLVTMRRAGSRLPLRLVHAAAFAVLLWRLPVPAVWSFALAQLAWPWARRWWLRLAALGPLLGLIALATVAWGRGAVDGLWLRPWELGLAGLLTLLLMLPAAAGKKAPRRKASAGRRRGLPKRGRSGG
jgi:hypothetical protein